MKLKIWLMIFCGTAFCTGTGLAQTGREPAVQERAVEGEVLAMPQILERKQIKADHPPLENQVALLSADGQVLPLLSDEGGRLFFLDKTMLGRPVRLKLRSRSDLPFVQVIGVELKHEGRWRVPQYYCDVCTIAVRYPQICLCCQGPMEFRLKPER